MSTRLDPIPSCTSGKLPRLRTQFGWISSENTEIRGELQQILGSSFPREPECGSFVGPEISCPGRINSKAQQVPFEAKVVDFFDNDLTCFTFFSFICYLRFFSKTTTGS